MISNPSKRLIRDEIQRLEMRRAGLQKALREPQRRKAVIEGRIGRIDNMLEKLKGDLNGGS